MNNHGLLASEELARCLWAIQAFAIRRLITGVSTRPYYRLFPTAIRELHHEDTLGSLARYLKGREWPSDEDFVPTLVTYPIYWRAPEIARLLLMVLEEEEGHKEPVDVANLLAQNKIQLEHVMPQTINDDANGDAWKEMLGESWPEVHNAWLHTIGNLTLTGYNPNLSNKPFEDKRAEFKRSHLEVNRYFSECDAWDAVAIRNRGEALANRVAELWPAAKTFLPED
jgi:hypothetical protein